MKSYSSFLPIFLIFLSSCTSFQPYAGARTDFPLRPGKSVEVFYPGELLPSKEYVEVGTLAIAEGLSRNKLTYVNRLRAIAKNSGMDALIDIRRIRHENKYVDDTGYVNDVSYSYNATGVKYLKNVNYLDEYIREETFYTLESSQKTKTLSGVLERTPSGRTLESRFVNDEAQSIYQMYVQEYRDYHLIEEQSNWSYKMNTFEDAPLARRYTQSNNWKIKTCKFHYKKNKLTWINIYYHDKDAYTKVYYSYDSKGRTARRELLLTNGIKVLEKYGYDGDGKLIRKDYEIQSIYADYSQKYVSEYEYYQKEDIHDFIGR